MKAQTRANPFAQPRPMAPATESRNIVSLQWTAIRTDGGTQARITIDEETVSEYADAMRKGARFPAIICYYDGAEYWLADGFHRHKAHFQAHGTAEKIAAEVRQGTRRDAVLFAVGANSDHGLRRTHADKRNAVLTLLRDEDWTGWSDRQIAERTKTTHPFVGSLRRKLAETTGNDYQSARTGADGRTIDTAKIGANQPTRTSKPITQPQANAKHLRKHANNTHHQRPDHLPVAGNGVRSPLWQQCQRGERTNPGNQKLVPLRLDRPRFTRYEAQPVSPRPVT
jgi:hypothetical protein